MTEKSLTPFEQRAKLLLEVGKSQKVFTDVTVNGSEIYDILRTTAELREKISALESELVIEKARYTDKTVELYRADKLIGKANKRAEQAENTVKELRLLNAEKKRAHEDVFNAVKAQCDELEKKLAMCNKRERELRDVVGNLQAHNKIVEAARDEQLKRSLCLGEEIHRLESLLIEAQQVCNSGNGKVTCKSGDNTVRLEDLVFAFKLVDQWGSNEGSQRAVRYLERRICNT